MLVYDGDCAFCTASANWVRKRLDGDHAVVAWQEVDDLAALGLTPADVAAAAWWVEDGRAWRGHRAVSRALRSAGGGWGVAGRVLDVPPVRWLAAVSYRGAARVRRALPGAPPCVDC